MMQVNSKLMQMVFCPLPIPKRMPMCATSSNWCELAIVIGAGEWSISGITARLFNTRHLPTYVYSDRVLRGKYMKFVGVVHIYIPFSVQFWFIYHQQWLFYCCCAEGHVKRFETNSFPARTEQGPACIKGHRKSSF